MAETIKETKKVVIIGGGASGLTVGNMLESIGIDCVILEHRSQEYVQFRQRAGIVEFRAVQMFHRWGMGDLIVGPPYDGTIIVSIDGEHHEMIEIREDDPSLPIARFCPQQALVFGLIARLADKGDLLRFECEDVAISGIDDGKPMVSYVDKDGVRHEISCDYIAGCDGDHGVSATAIPADVLKTYEEPFGRAWLSWMADVPPPRKLFVGISEHGYSCHIARGPHASRFYLECPAGDSPDNWPDERIWDEFRKRSYQPDYPTGEVSQKTVFELRSSVREPMRYKSLFLVGDAAHIVVPVSGKGMNLALRDAELLVDGLRDMIKNGDSSGIDSYSEKCLERIWAYQEFTLNLAEAFHDAGDKSLRGDFRGKVAVARTKRMCKSEWISRAYGEMMGGID